MNSRIMSFETVRDNGRDEASRERYYRLFLKKGTLL